MSHKVRPDDCWLRHQAAPGFDQPSGHHVSRPDRYVGQPNDQQTVAGVRTLSYRRGFAWRGLAAFVNLPVPLLLPMGHTDAVFRFRNDQLVHTEYTSNLLDSAICGLHSESPDGVGCIAHWH